MTNETTTTKAITTHDLTEMVRSGLLREHHTATIRGYVSRRGDGVVRKYNGKFGNGYAWIRPNWKSSTYCYITYYIKNERN